MNIFLDTEFSKLPWEKGSQLISVALVDETGKGYSACLDDIDLNNVSEFVKEKVIPYLPKETDRKSRELISKEVENLLGDKEDLVFWAVFPTKKQLLNYGLTEEKSEGLYNKFADYDFQLFKGLWNGKYLPLSIPEKCNDLSPLIAEIPKENLPENTKSHDPLSDAYWDLEVWKKYNNLNNKGQ